MLDLAKMDCGLPAPKDREEADIGALLAACDAHGTAPLLFSYDGRTAKPGYHVTEVKAATFQAMDCGGNPEAWTEIFVQLWDVVDGDRTHMLAGKFAAIVRKVSEYIALDAGARLTFEVSDGVAPMQLHRAAAPDLLDGALRVDLLPRAASCKPRDRWLEERKAAACCGPAAAMQPCCG